GRRTDPFGSRVDAELDLRESLAGNLAGVLQRDLAHVAKTFAPLLGADPVLDHPALVVAAHPDAEPRHRVAPLEMIDLARRQSQRSHGVFCQLHGSRSLLLPSGHGRILESEWEAF